MLSIYLTGFVVTLLIMFTVIFEGNQDIILLSVFWGIVFAVFWVFTVPGMFIFNLIEYIKYKRGY